MSCGLGEERSMKHPSATTIQRKMCFFTIWRLEETSAGSEDQAVGRGQRWTLMWYPEAVGHRGHCGDPGPAGRPAEETSAHHTPASAGTFSIHGHAFSVVTRAQRVRAVRQWPKLTVAQGPSAWSSQTSDGVFSLTGTNLMITTHRSPATSSVRPESLG